MGVVDVQAQLLGQVVGPAHGILNLGLLLQDAAVELALILLQLGVQSGLRHACHCLQSPKDVDVSSPICPLAPGL